MASNQLIRFLSAILLVLICITCYVSAQGAFESNAIYFHHSGLILTEFRVTQEEIDPKYTTEYFNATILNDVKTDITHAYYQVSTVTNEQVTNDVKSFGKYKRKISHQQPITPDIAPSEQIFSIIYAGNPTKSDNIPEKLGHIEFGWSLHTATTPDDDKDDKKVQLLEDDNINETIKEEIVLPQYDNFIDKYHDKLIKLPQTSSSSLTASPSSVDIDNTLDDDEYPYKYQFDIQFDVLKSIDLEQLTSFSMFFIGDYKIYSPSRPDTYTDEDEYQIQCTVNKHKDSDHHQTYTLIMAGNEVIMNFTPTPAPAPPTPIMQEQQQQEEQEEDDQDAFPIHKDHIQRIHIQCSDDDLIVLKKQKKDDFYAILASANIQQPQQQQQQSEQTHMVVEQTYMSLVATGVPHVKINQEATPPRIIFFLFITAIVIIGTIVGIIIEIRNRKARDAAREEEQGLLVNDQ